MSIANVTLQDTFDEWRTKTNQTIEQNRQLQVSVVDLIARANTLNTSSLASSSVANLGFSHANAAYAEANAGFAIANAGIIQANTARLQANSAYDFANTVESLTRIVFDHSNASFSQANSGRSQANVGFEQANTAYNRANAAFAEAVSAKTEGGPAFTTANLAFLQANTARTHANAAFAKANTIGTMGTQSAAGVSITGGTIVGITDISVADGGTGSSTPAGARTNLGIGNNAVRNIMVSTSAPSGGVDGDVWYKV
jgi:hypothetical protein